MAEIMDHINTILFWVLLYVLLWQAYILFFNKSIPNITTAPAIRKAIIDKMKELGPKAPIIYDLGCDTVNLPVKLLKKFQILKFLALKLIKLPIPRLL